MLDQNLVNAVKASLGRGETKEQIYQTQISQGHTVLAISDAIEALSAESKKGEAQKRSVSAVVIIGAVLVIAGVFSFVAKNWIYFSKPLKLTIIFTSMLVAYASGWYVKEVKQWVKSGLALIVLGNIIYGLGIFLVAQMFKINANWPDGFVLWMLGILALSFALDFKGILYFGGFIGIIAFLGYPSSIYNNLPAFDALLFTSFLLLALTTAVCFLVFRYFRQKAEITDQKDIY